MIFRKKKLALALDSGSAKGIAHIGVIEKLISSGYEISAVAGCSMGAVIAAYYAMGKLELLKEWLLSLDKKSTFNTIDFSIGGGFIGGKKLMNAFENHLGNASFGDTSVPLYISATNLDEGRERVFSQGEILPAIRASISIPGIMRPYFYENAYYVDGAVTNPLPVDVLLKNNHKNIVAVHLHEYMEQRSSASAPRVLETALRSMDIVSRYLAKAKIGAAMAVITPDTAGFDMFHFYRAKEIMERGEKAAEDVIDSGALDSAAIKLLNAVRTGFSRS